MLIYFHIQVKCHNIISKQRMQMIGHHSGGTTVPQPPCFARPKNDNKRRGALENFEKKTERGVVFTFTRETNYDSLINWYAMIYFQTNLQYFIPRLDLSIWFSRTPWFECDHEDMTWSSTLAASNTKTCKTEISIFNLIFRFHHHKKYILSYLPG